MGSPANPLPAGRHRARPRTGEMQCSPAGPMKRSLPLRHRRCDARRDVSRLIARNLIRAASCPALQRMGNAPLPFPATVHPTSQRMSMTFAALDCGRIGSRWSWSSGRWKPKDRRWHWWRMRPRCRASGWQRAARCACRTGWHGGGGGQVGDASWEELRFSVEHAAYCIEASHPSPALLPAVAPFTACLRRIHPSDGTSCRAMRHAARRAQSSEVPASRRALAVAVR